MRISRSFAAALAIGFVAPAMTIAATINVGNHTLLPNTPHQAIQIFVSGGDSLVQGLDLSAEILNGTTIAPADSPAAVARYAGDTSTTARVSGPISLVGIGPESTSGPTIGPATITSPDVITGTIFASNNTGEFVVYGGDPHLVEVSASDASGYVTASGLLGTIYVDTTGLFSGAWTLSLNAPDFIASDLPGWSPAIQDVVNYLSTINDGIITIATPAPRIPEPSTAVLALFAAAGLGAAAFRKRMARR